MPSFRSAIPCSVQRQSDFDTDDNQTWTRCERTQGLLVEGV
jgi:hypothetical protein